MSSLTSGKPFFFSVFQKQAKRIMPKTESPSDPPSTLVDGKYYRVWFLAGQRFLKLIPKDGNKKNADFSETREKSSSE